jgi:gas vesicle protein
LVFAGEGRARFLTPANKYKKLHSKKEILMRNKYELERTANSAKPVVTGLLIGGAIGAVAALLFAPRSGEETRAELRDKAMEYREKAMETVNDTVSQAKSKASELTDRAKDKADELRHRTKEMADKEYERVSQAAETGKRKVQEY